MATAVDIMGGGFSAGQAKAIGGQSSDTFSAAGTTQGTAAAIKSSITIITTCSNNAGVIMPNSSHKDSFWIYNGTANTCIVYPPTSAQFNDVAVNSGITLASHTVIIVIKVTNTRWLANLSA